MPLTVQWPTVAIDNQSSTHYSVIFLLGEAKYSPDILAVISNFVGLKYSP